MSYGAMALKKRYILFFMVLGMRYFAELTNSFQETSELSPACLSCIVYNIWLTTSFG